MHGLGIDTDYSIFTGSGLGSGFETALSRRPVNTEYPNNRTRLMYHDGVVAHSELSQKDMEYSSDYRRL